MTTKIKSGVISDNAITSAHISSGAISSSHLTSIDTDNITEGSSNLYFTTARVDSHLSGGTGVTYSSGAISIGQSVATSASPTFANLTLTGNLNITGDVDSVSVTDLDVTDKTITVGVGGTASANDGAGIVVDGASASILWDNSNTSWDFNNPIESSRVNTNTVNNVGNSANIIYRSSTNTIVGNNANALVVQDGGNVGIGTTSPDALLEVEGSNATGDGIRVGTSSNSNTGSTTIALQTNNADRVAIKGTRESSTGGKLTFETKDVGGSLTEKMVIKNDGNVGIGTQNPLFPLHVDRDATGDIAHFEGQGSVHLRIGEDSNTMYLNANNGTAEIAFRSNDSEKMRIDSSGNVGIGRTDPSAILHVEVADNTEFLKATITGNESWAFKGASGSGATDYVSFGLSGSTQCMTWQEDGNVGIGTSSPSNKLHVVGDVFAEGGSFYVGNGGVVASDSTNRNLSFGIGNTTAKMTLDTSGRLHLGSTIDTNHKGLTISKTTNDSYSPSSFNDESLLRLYVPNAEGNYAGITYTHEGGTEFFTGLVRVGATADITDYVFQGYNGNTNAYQEYMRIDSSGNIGIGDSSPQDYLEINGSGRGLGGLTISNSTHNHAALSFARSSTATARIFISEPAATHTSKFNFQTSNASGGGANLVTAMVIDENQRVGIGTSNPSGSVHLTTVDSGGADVHYVAQNTINNRIAGYKILDENGNNYVSLTYDNGSNRGNLNLGQADGEILYVYGGSTVKSGFGIDLSGSSRELSIFHTTSGSNGNISFGERLESSGAYTEHMRIDYKGTKLADGAMAYEQDRPLFSGANASSYSDSTNLAYTKATDQYSVTGEAFKARVRARAYTKYVHMKTNLSSDNIMFFFRIYGYFYNYGVNECVRGGYTYNTTQVIAEAVANAYNTNSNYTIGDFYRSSSGNYLCIRLDVHQTGYTEGEALVFFGSHSNTVTRELEITDMQHRDDGNNAY